MEADVISPAERAEYEAYVLESLRDAKADAALLVSSTVLEKFDDDILEDAGRELRHAFETSFSQNSNMTVGLLAEALWSAVTKRQLHWPLDG
jgi:hypothetical protein